MASIQKRNGSYKLTFYHQDRRRYVTLGKVTEREAEAKAAAVDYLMLRVKQGLVEIPPGVPVEDFVLADGKLKESDKPRPLATNFATLKDRYLETHRNGAIEGNSLGTVKIHFAHLTRTLGDGFPLAPLALGDLQRQVDSRLKMKHRGKSISPETIKKELSTLRTVWNWGGRMGLVAGAFPNKGLVYPKSDEKPPFQTIDSIRRRVELGGLTRAQMSEFWDSLFLTLPEIDEMLVDALKSAAHPWIHPLPCFAALTGARPSEMLRVQVADVNLEAATVIIREKKRVKGQRTTRRVPLSPTLVSVLREGLRSTPVGLISSVTAAMSSGARNGVAPPAIRTARTGRQASKAGSPRSVNAMPPSHRR